MRQRGQEILERLQIRSAAEKIVQHLIFNVRHQLDEHVVGFGFVFNERILLRVTAQVNAFAQRIHRVKMLLPKPINRVQNNVAFETLDRGWFFVTRLALVSIFDLCDQKLRIFVHTARLELRFLLGQAKREGRVYPMNKTDIVRFIRINIFFHFRRDRFVDHFVDQLSRFRGVDCLVAISVDDFALIVHHVVEVERPFTGEIISLFDALLRRLDRLVQPRVL